MKLTRQKINELTEQQLDLIFEKMENDVELAIALEKIDNHDKFSEDKKQLLRNYRMDLAFERIAEDFLNQQI